MGALAVLGSPFNSGALAFFQQQQIYIKNHRLKEYGDCYLLMHVHHGTWVEVLGVVQCEFSVPADVWMRSDLFRLKMVHLCLTPIVNYSRNSLAGLKMFSKLKLKFPDQGFFFYRHMFCNQNCKMYSWLDFTDLSFELSQNIFILKKVNSTAKVLITLKDEFSQTNFKC